MVWIQFIGCTLLIVHAATLGSAITVTGLAMIRPFSKPRGRPLGTISWVSVALMTNDMLTTGRLFLHGK